MRHGSKKILTLLLALVMLLGMIPLSAYAFGVEGKEQVTARGNVEKISAQGTRGGY